MHFQIKSWDICNVHPFHHLSFTSFFCWFFFWTNYCALSYVQWQSICLCSDISTGIVPDYEYMMMDKGVSFCFVPFHPINFIWFPHWRVFLVSGERCVDTSNHQVIYGTFLTVGLMFTWTFHGHHRNAFLTSAYPTLFTMLGDKVRKAMIPVPCAGQCG